MRFIKQFFVVSLLGSLSANSLGSELDDLATEAIEGRFATATLLSDNQVIARLMPFTDNHCIYPVPGVLSLTDG